MSLSTDRPRGADDAWWSVDEPAAVGAVRRAAAALATASGFGTERVAETEIVVTELATNLVRHAGGGELVLRTVGRDPSTGRGTGVRVLALDSGPGSRNIAALISDGASTRGTLGIGLGACRRLSTAFDVYSVPGLGTIAEALVERTPTPPLAPGVERDAPGGRLADLTRPLSGEGPCGDTTAHRVTDGAHLAMVADGLGHGPLAAAASRRAAEVFLASTTGSPAAALDGIHAALGSTRGAAIAVVRYEPETRTLSHAGVGNVAVRLVGPGAPRSLPSQPGIVGHRSPRLREMAVPVGDHTAVVMHSDGLSQRWNLEDMPDVMSHRPAVFCAALLRRAASRRDDASVLVMRTAA